MDAKKPTTERERAKGAAWAVAVVLALVGARGVASAEPPEEGERIAGPMEMRLHPQPAPQETAGPVVIAVATAAALGLVVVQGLLERRVRSRKGRLRVE